MVIVGWKEEKTQKLSRHVWLLAWTSEAIIQRRVNMTKTEESGKWTRAKAEIVKKMYENRLRIFDGLENDWW